MTPIALTPRNDPSRPNLVWAPAPDDKTRFVRLLASPETVAKMYATGRGAAIGQYEALVLGIIRRTTAFGEVSELFTGGLATAVALFRGLRRPMIDLRVDAEPYVYVLNPPHDYNYERGSGIWSPGPVRKEKPPCAVFTVFVRFGDDVVAPFADYIADLGAENVAGIILNWNWTWCSPDDSSLPDRYGTRYEQRVW